MAKSQNQKLKLIYLARLMQEKTDDEHERKHLLHGG